MLVVHQRRHEHFLRQRQERAVEEAGDDGRVLDEVGDFVDERGVLLDLHASTQPPRVHLERADDPVSPLGVIEDDEVLLEPGFVLLEAAYLDRSPGAAAGRKEPVAVRQSAGRDVLHRCTAGVRRAAD
jgi:hypothetical protein